MIQLETSRRLGWRSGNGLFRNAEVEPHNDYTYDALYRLRRAEGREHAAQNNFQRDAAEFAVLDISFPDSPEALQTYLEEYSYDNVGNILSIRHVGGALERWTRRYHYAAENDRLLATSLPGDGPNEFSARYSYDAHGNMTMMPHLPLLQWDFNDQLQASSAQVVSTTTRRKRPYYVHNAAGERVRKSDRAAICRWTDPDPPRGTHLPRRFRDFPRV
jgi:hypothetical protein